MKIRIEGNSIRLRLRKSELETFAHDEEVIERVNFNEAHLIYVLKMTSEDEVRTEFLDNKIKVLVPKDEAMHWVNSNEVAIKNQEATPQILIEKDFKCTTDQCIESEKDQSDFFDNPKETC